MHFDDDSWKSQTAHAIPRSRNCCAIGTVAGSGPLSRDMSRFATKPVAQDCSEAPLDQERVEKQHHWAWRYLPSRAGSNLASGLTLLDEQRKPGGTLETPRDENGCARACGRDT